MAEIQKLTITLKPGDFVDAFVLVKGQYVEVRVQTDSDPKPTPTFHWPGGGHAAPMVVVSGPSSSDVGELLTMVTDEDSAGLGAYTVERTDKTGAGRVVLDTPVDSEISLEMKDLGGL